MNPLSDIGMPDNFWEKYRARCSKIEGLHPECQCGSGLPITVNHIPLWTKTEIIWVTNSFLSCLACATRSLWKTFAKESIKEEMSEGKKDHRKGKERKSKEKKIPWTRNSKQN